MMLALQAANPAFMDLTTTQVKRREAPQEEVTDTSDDLSIDASLGDGRCPNLVLLICRSFWETGLP